MRIGQYQVGAVAKGFHHPDPNAVEISATIRIFLGTLALRDRERNPETATYKWLAMVHPVCSSGHFSRAVRQMQIAFSFL